MAKDLIRTAARLYFARESSAEKKESQLKKICEIMAQAREVERLRKVAELVAWLNGQLFEQRSQQLKDRQDVFIDELVVSLIDRGGYDAFYQSTWLTIFEAGTGWSDRELAGLRRFNIAFLRVIGANVERSMQFALNLLERFSRSRVLYHGLGTADHAQLAKNREEQEAATVLMVLRDSALAPVGRITPSKEWMLRLIERIESDRAVSSTWNDIIELMRIDANGEGKECEVLDLGVPAVEAQHRELYMSQELTIASLNSKKLLFALPSAHRLIFLRWGRSLRQRNDALRERCERMEAWARSNEGMLDAKAERLLREVAERPRRGLRPLGYDHVDIDISILRSAGIWGIVFRPEGFTLPDTGIEILARKVTPHLHAYTGSLGKFNDLDPLLIDGGFCRDHALARKLLRFVAIDILHRITVAERPLRETKLADVGGKAPPGAPHPVRPHLRRLLVGQSASEEARMRGMESLGYSLPEGVTFVRAHYSHGQMIYDLPTTAFATYGDEDLFDLGGAP